MTGVPLSTPVPVARPLARPAPWATLGILFGLLAAAAIALYGPIGVSGTYPRFVGAVLRRVAPGYAAANPYLVKMGSLVTPETMLVVGLLVGGFLAARLGRGRAPAIETVHARETTTRRRYLDAFAGGFLILFGARLAGGCTSGHIISGITQLAVSSLLFGAAVFASGMLTARLIKGGH
ncbi:MAG TPA: YeeE/YedE thiosulfate transporter family protein [Gemmatimonadaceae bacterium]|nr:YeeE/YedE thiosulfate transporter family protein [Gemmatimonadaceae bacterium]